MALMLEVYSCLQADGLSPPLDVPSLDTHAQAASAWSSLRLQCVFQLKLCEKVIPTHFAVPFDPKLISSSLAVSLDHPWARNVVYPV